MSRGSCRSYLCKFSNWFLHRAKHTPRLSPEVNRTRFFFIHVSFSKLSIHKPIFFATCWTGVRDSLTRDLSRYPSIIHISNGHSSFWIFPMTYAADIGVRCLYLPVAVISSRTIWRWIFLMLLSLFIPHDLRSHRWIFQPFFFRCPFPGGDLFPVPFRIPTPFFYEVAGSCDDKVYD